MSGHVGLREDARVGHLLAQQIAQLFPVPAFVAAQRPSRAEQPQCAHAGGPTATACQRSDVRGHR